MFKKLKERKLLSINRALRDRHRDQKRCFVVGNGPSLKKQDLLPLKNEMVIVCNFFNLHPLCAEIAPRYFCFADPNAFVAGTFNSDLEINRAEWFKDIRQKAPGAEFFVPLSSYAMVKEGRWFGERPVWPVATSGRSTCQIGRAESSLDRPIAEGMGTIAAQAIPAAIYMGFQEIYLLGCDCNWFVENLAKEDFDAECAHFYGKNPYVNRECNLRDFGLEHEFMCLSQHFKSMRLLREHAENLGAKILNASAGGLLDCFPRVSYEAVLAGGKS